MLFEQYRQIGDTSAADIHDHLKTLYNIYCCIGGYPKVVETYLLEKDTERAQAELVKIIDTFTNESIRYFTDILDTPATVPSPGFIPAASSDSVGRLRNWTF